ncbi:conserved hypothetical protein (DUF4098) [Formosa agariphila KMM 3901]|uniref:Uncharacterized protein n=1 Tax=Formosa agariphila (strain DSM 15362 / KCTC 12365 / LMG 23005 / KMM 3901 / M-2Alg 35-1) TaxID=1347342 RepID=T2KR76_FORAG|nr:DUF4097 family beta strand repeat-containing protein [Formosa agariphila]CDF81023.1 conserved hypothetical protein (DUF4098) [Formosa agariphila KMM 3901]
MALNAQKRVDKSIDAQGLSTLQIDGNNCFKIRVTASQTNRILIQTNIAGEHNEDMVVVAKRSNDSLMISTRFQPLFEADNDKLSVHKLISVELEIQLPKHMNLNIKSDIASVEAQGDFNTAFIELNQGNCTLASFSGSATVNTVQGDIYVEANYVKVSADSRHGVVKLQKLNFGENHLNLKSIHGDISVFKTE